MLLFCIFIIYRLHSQILLCNTIKLWISKPYTLHNIQMFFYSNILLFEPHFKTANVSIHAYIHMYKNLEYN